jgi:hypothetical protein
MKKNLDSLLLAISSLMMRYPFAPDWTQHPTITLKNRAFACKIFRLY